MLEINWDNNIGDFLVICMAVQLRFDWLLDSIIKKIGFDWFVKAESYLHVWWKLKGYEK